MLSAFCEYSIVHVRACVCVCVICRKYKTMRQRYIRFVTAGEPELQSYTAGGAGGRETSPEDLAPGKRYYEGHSK